MPRGGARPGSGRKKKTEHAIWVAGNASKLAEVPKERPKSKPFQLMPAPAHLPEAQAAVWNDLAPQACQQRTLNTQTMAAFELLCKQIVLERMMFDQILADGLTGNKVTLQMDASGGGLQSVEKKAHTLLAQHRGMMQRVEAGMVRFRLSPMGKELDVPDEGPKDEWAEFDSGPVQ